MKNRLTLKLVGFCILHSAFCLSASAQGTAFTYQGRLHDGVTPASGIYDLRFTIHDSTNNPGVVIAGPLTNSAVIVSGGLFTVTLDFGPGTFTGAERWLEIGVRSNALGAFMPLAPRARITPAPYAIYAANAGASANYLGPIALSQLPPAVVTNGASGVQFSGTFSGSGAGITNINLFVNSSGAIDPSAHFALAATLATGTNPRRVIAADVNGDGKLDLVSANENGGTLSVLTNDGSGGFALGSTLISGGTPVSVAAADFNSDGRLDLVSANYQGQNLVVFTNNGSGGFVFSTTLFLGTQPGCAIAVDVNGDGKADVISANILIDTLAVFTNNGSGGFVLSSVSGVGDGPRSVVAADFNGDGRTDLATANVATDTLSVLTNDGSGGFALASTPFVDYSAFELAVAEINKDGKPDLVGASLSTGSLFVLTNNGSGGFVLAATSAPGGVAVATADVNGDGEVDLIGSNGSSILSVFTNNGSGSFALAASPEAGNYPASLVAVDVNGDGRADIISANGSDSTLSVLFNTIHFQGTFTGFGPGLTGLNASGIASGTLADARLSTNVALLNRADQRFTGSNSFANVTINPPAVLSFGAASRQQLNLYSTAYGIGVQTYTHFFRTDAGASFAWYEAGEFIDSYQNSGGGTTLMTLNADGLAIGLGAGVPAQQRLSVASGANIDQNDANSGTVANTLRFGSNSGEAIGSKRTAGGNQFGLDFYTGSTSRLTILNNGNVGIGTSSPTNKLHVNGGITCTALVQTSDRHAKENFEPVSGADVLARVAALPISRWNFKSLRDGRHLGPMAQDFYAAFGLGETDTGIAAVDADGVALAAIQGLNQKVEVRMQNAEVRNRRLEEEITDLKQRLAALESIIRDQKSN